MHPLLLLATDAAATASGWLPFIERVGIPVAMAGAILWWALTRLERKLDEFPAAMRENTKATVDFTAAMREQTAALRELRGEVADIRGENTGKHIVPLELRAGAGGK